MSVVYKHAILTKIISMLHIIINSNILQCQTFEIGLLKSIVQDNIRLGEFKHEVRQFQKPYDNQQAEQTSLMV